MLHSTFELGWAIEFSAQRFLVFGLLTAQENYGLGYVNPPNVDFDMLCPILTPSIFTSSQLTNRSYSLSFRTSRSLHSPSIFSTNSLAISLSGGSP